MSLFLLRAAFYAHRQALCPIQSNFYAKIGGNHVFGFFIGGIVLGFLEMPKTVLKYFQMKIDIFI
ncbi:MAG: hypothetical protein A2270_09045 [Elusimicrobia bacterium RIFOXYA12_FULL_51_18]|nr:MAG: hypothetical protein A2270_09045 [Elusimicrobia bacterium RIFOXYA12_FULL_51_18]OGS32231.1 MAG: hypothetical protein A2218_03930 [Elusimicrobia bacterium RIFOXYA2_FULL_53_38]